MSVPAGMTHFFQPLDLTVNGEAKCFMKDTFTTWYSAEVQKQMESGNSTDEIEVDLRLSVLKPLHATWLVSLYNHLTGTLQKDGAKPEYPNLFKGRQPYRLKIHSKTLRRSFSKSYLAVPSSKIVSRLPVSVYF